jgi:hypothetical protein
MKRKLIIGYFKYPNITTSTKYNNKKKIIMILKLIMILISIEIKHFLLSLYYSANLHVINFFHKTYFES